MRSWYKTPAKPSHFLYKNLAKHFCDVSRQFLEKKGYFQPQITFVVNLSPKQGGTTHEYNTWGKSNRKHGKKIKQKKRISCL
jgi:hypothetical protein